jgi:hypothetical protein
VKKDDEKKRAAVDAFIAYMRKNPKRRIVFTKGNKELTARAVFDEEGKKLIARIKRFGVAYNELPKGHSIRRAVVAAAMRAPVVMGEKEMPPGAKSIRAFVKVRGKDEYIVNPRLKGKT